LGSPKTIIIKTRSLDALTAISINIWQRIVRSQRKKKKLGNAISATK